MQLGRKLRSGDEQALSVTSQMRNPDSFAWRRSLFFKHAQAGIDALFP
jgi:hypothetical protein